MRHLDIDDELEVMIENPADGKYVLRLTVRKLANAFCDKFPHWGWDGSVKKANIVAAMLLGEEIRSGDEIVTPGDALASFLITNFNGKRIADPAHN